MNNALLTLARQLAAVPGTPRRNLAMLRCDTDLNNGYRDESGVRWVWDPDDHDLTAIDLADPATGGVLLNLIPSAERWRVRPLGNGLYDANLAELGGMGALCPTLAEACARVIVALGRVGDV